MRRFTRYAVLATLIVGFLIQSESRAATPMRIDIKRVTIEHAANWMATLIRITAVDEAGTELVYGGQAGYVLNGLDSCRPCNMPTSFNTNEFSSFHLDFGQDTHGNFTLLQGQSDPVTVPATILRKPQTFFRTGAASFKAKFTYSDLHGLIAYDDDVEMVGTYTIEFGHVPIFDGHQISFYRFFYDLAPPSN